MSLFARLLQRTPPSRRAYSFFSSKPGGGRYFNSAKPAKVVTAAKSKAEPSSTTSNPTTLSPSASPPGAKLAEDAPSQSASSVALPPPKDIPSQTPSSPSSPPSHPALKAHDFKLHHFFSLHRPLLLHSLPASTLFEPPPSSSDLTGNGANTALPAEFAGLDDPPESSPEADADAARQLARALVMSRVGGVMDWSETLQRLGLDEAVGGSALRGSVVVVNMDSTKRKKRRKMSKHKYKKRRKLQRAQRLKIGK